MALISVRHKGSFKKTNKYMSKLAELQFLNKLNKYGQMGVEALSAATPVRTGKTAASWRYVIEKQGESLSLTWENTNEASDGNNIVKMLVRGHGTRAGSYVAGRDFVTPAIQPIFDQIQAELSKEVTKL